MVNGKRRDNIAIQATLYTQATGNQHIRMPRIAKHEEARRNQKKPMEGRSNIAKPLGPEKVCARLGTPEGCYE